MTLAEFHVTLINVIINNFKCNFQLLVYNINFKIIDWESSLYLLVIFITTRTQYRTSLKGGPLKIEAICSFETSVEFKRTTRCYIPEDSTLHNHRCENLKSYITEVVYSLSLLCVIEAYMASHRLYKALKQWAVSQLR
jgi:hypothetical protein